MGYSLSKTTSLNYDPAVGKVTEELKEEGFGVLTTIDVKETLKKKINVDFNRYIILGACNPPFANQALQADPEIGLLLPCNVIVYEQEGATHVPALDPTAALSLTDRQGVEAIAGEVQARLERVIARM